MILSQIVTFKQLVGTQQKVDVFEFLTKAFKKSFYF